MAEMVLRLEELPERPLDAAAWFLSNCVSEIRSDFRTMASSPCCMTIVFETAGPEHRSWRLAAVQELAREVAPNRINAIASDSEAATAAAVAFLNGAEGVTGQLLELDDTGAGEVVTSWS